MPVKSAVGLTYPICSAVGAKSTALHDWRLMRPAIAIPGMDSRSELATKSYPIIVNLGHGDASKIFARSPRLSFEEACKIV